MLKFSGLSGSELSRVFLDTDAGLHLCVQTGIMCVSRIQEH